MIELSPMESQFRDAIIIFLYVEEASRAGDQPVEIVSRLAGKPLPSVPLTEGREVNAPLILLEGDRRRYGLDGLYLDPPSIGAAIPISIYLSKWAGFARLLLSSKAIENVPQCEYAYHLVSRSVIDCRQNRGSHDARSLAQKLHQHRWMAGPEVSASLLTLATIDVTQPQAFEQLVNNQFFIDEQIRTVRAALARAKQSVTTLTDWCEALYLLNPAVWELLGYLARSELPEAEQWHRFFAEVDANIAPCSIRDVSSTVRKELSRPTVLSWKDTFVSERARSTTIKEFKERLQYLLHARTCIPKFWFDMALQLYDVAEDKLPAELDEIDQRRAVSTSILRKWSLRWTHIRRAEQQAEAH